MGVLLDSTFLISADRRGLSAKTALTPISVSFPNEPVAISVISLMELAHGIERADTPERAALRERFVQQVASTVTVFPVSASIAVQAGRLSGSLMRNGVQVASPDLLIGVTALELRYKVVTGNVRHFRRIPGLQLVEL